jgi:RNA polymerase sigma-70 factor (ECF subfamily)
VSAILKTGEGRPDDSAGTLGALLYGNKSSLGISEADWAGLVRALAAGDAGALRALHDRSHRLVFTLALRLCADRATAEEVTVDVFHDLWRRAGTYDPNVGTVLAWIMNQTRSRALDRVRHEHRAKRTAPAVNGHNSRDAADPAPEASSAIEHAELGRRLREALAGLGLAERQAIETAFFGEMSYAETAVALETPAGTIKTRIRSGLAKLRQVLRGEQL